MHRRRDSSPAIAREALCRIDARPSGHARAARIARLRGLLFCLAWLPLSAAAAAQSCLVVDVSQGDTLRVRCGGPGDYSQVKVRVAGIDAPVRGQPYGDVARTELAGLCFRYMAEIQEVGRNQDGQVVAHVRCREIDVAKHLVGRGLARLDSANLDRSGDLHLLEDNARSHGYGLWSNLASATRWEWPQDGCSSILSLRRCK